MAEFSEKRKIDLIQKLASEYIVRESNHTSLITVTKVEVFARGSRADIFFTVLPEHKEEAALDFLQRSKSDFRGYVMEKSRIPRIPMFDFKIDVGEKNRQKVENLI